MTPPGRPRLTRIAIRDRALEIIDSEGLEALSMRRLADQLGVQAASIYSHYSSKDTVLDAIANLLAQSIDATDFDVSWQQGMRVWGTTYHAALRRHPNAAPIVAAGAREREDYLAMSDQIHGGLLRHGWPPRHATMVAASVKYLVLGAATTPFGSGFAQDTAVYLDRYPNLTQAHLISQVADKIDRDSFTLALDALIRGLEHVHSGVVSRRERDASVPPAR